jgi:hypothetical protein
MGIQTQSCYLKMNEDIYYPGGDIYYQNINDNNLISDNIKQLNIKHGITRNRDIIGNDKFIPNEFTQKDLENSIFILTNTKTDQFSKKDSKVNISCVKQANNNQTFDPLKNRPYNFIADGGAYTGTMEVLSVALAVKHSLIEHSCEDNDYNRQPHPSAKCNSDDKGQLWYLYKGKLCSMKDDTCLRIYNYNEKSNYTNYGWKRNNFFVLPTNDKNYIQNTNDKTQQWKLEKVLGGFSLITDNYAHFNFTYPDKATNNNKYNSKLAQQILNPIGTGIDVVPYLQTKNTTPVIHKHWTTGMIIPIYQLKKKENNEFKSMPDPPIGGYWRMQDFCKNDEYTNKFNTNIKNEFKPIFNQFGFKESDIFTMSKLNNIKYFPDWATTKFPSEDIENCNWKEKWEKIKELSKGYIYMNNWCPYLYLRDKENINQCNYPQIVEAMFKCRAYDLNDLSCFPKRIEIHEKLCEKYGFTKNDSDVYEGCTLNTIMIKEQENLTKEIKKLNEELSVSIDEFRRQNLENQKRQLEHQLELFEQQQKSADRLADKTIKNIDDIVSFFDKEKESQEMKEKRIKNTAILLGILLFIFILFM